MDDSGVICDEVIGVDAEAKSNDEKNFHEKKATCKTQNVSILLAFY